MTKKLKLPIFLIAIILIYTLAIAAEPTKTKYIGEFYEFEAPSYNSKPDQIRVDPFDENVIWFTQPRINGIARFDHKTKIMKEYHTFGNYRPDGLVIDDEGILWFGEQCGYNPQTKDCDASTLGKFDPETEEFTHFKLPYKEANPAIPTVDNDGFIWVSDHENNKIVRFDPAKETFWVVEVPTPKSWVVDVKADSKNRIWYSCYESDKIGVLDQKTKTIKEYKLPKPKSGPAFLAIDSKDNIWFTQWKSDRIGKFDSVREVFVEYTISNSKPGPAAIAIGLNDIVYFSTKGLNSIIMFDPAKESYFHSFPIPTAKSGQKDGITVDSKGIVWFGEFDANKIGRLEIKTSDQVLLPGKSVKNRSYQTAISIKAVREVTRITKVDTFIVN